jgi:hypothetical protein
MHVVDILTAMLLPASFSTLPRRNAMSQQSASLLRPRKKSG